MRPLTHLQTAEIAAGAMLALAMREQLSDHEAAVIAEVSDRFLHAGWAAPVTESEWVVIEPVLALLPPGGRRMLGRAN